MNASLRTDFRRKCKEFPSEPSEIQFLEDLFEERSPLDHIPQELLLRALHFPLQWVRVNALYELFSRQGRGNGGELAGQLPRPPRKDLLNLPPNAVLSMAGEHAWSEEQLRPLLAARGIDLQPFSDKTTHLMLGIRPEGLPSSLPAEIILLKEEEVAQLVVDDPSFYLLQPNREVERGNLKTMLLSPEQSSMELAMQILERGGMPLDFVTELFTLKRSRKSFAIRQMAHDFLLRFTWGTFKQNLLRDYFGLLGSEARLLKADREVYDPEHFLDLGRYYHLKFIFSPGRDGNAETIVAYFQGLQDLPADTCQEVLNSMEQDRRLRFPKTTLAFPKLTYQMEQLKSIEIYFAPLKTLPTGISRLPSLIRIWFNCPLEALPEDFGATSSLRMVNLFNAEFPDFPAGLSDLSRLKIFRWEYCLADPEQTLVFPETFFQTPINTLTVMEKHIQFPDHFFQLKSLHSLALPYSAALEHLEKITTLPKLQRLSLRHGQDENPDLDLLRNRLGNAWRLEDQKERNLSFSRN